MSNFVKRFANGLAANFKRILQAVLFSVIIWFFISIQIFPDITLHVTDIPVICEPTPIMAEEHLQIASEPISDIAIQIEGKRYTISNLTADDFIAKCDLSGIYESGEYDVPIDIYPSDSNKECVILTKSIFAKIKVVKIVSREIPLSVDITGLNIAEGMRVEGDVTASPSSVIVSGEEKLVNMIGRVDASAVYDGELDQTADIPAQLRLYSSSGARLINHNVTLDTNDCTLNVPIYKVRTVPVSVKFSSNSNSFRADDLAYTMSVDEITIASPDSSVDNIKSLEVGEISLESLTLKDLQGGIQLPVNLPEGYKNISGIKNVTVSFPEADLFGQLGFTVTSDNISIMNMPSGYDIKVLTKEFVANVVGYSNYIQELTSSDITVLVNLLGTEIAEGTKNVSVTFKLRGANSKAWVTGEDYRVELLFVSNKEDEEETSYLDY